VRKETNQEKGQMETEQVDRGERGENRKKMTET
jgi:hypothetical protein